MSFAFSDRSTFNEDISGWDVSKVFDFERMFYNAETFDQDLNKWEISHTRELKYAREQMFDNATAFNQNNRKRPTYLN